MNTAPLYLAEIVAYDPALGTTRTIRVATRAFRTKPSEAPASTPYEVCLQQPTDISRSLFAPGATRGRSTMSLGDITLLNPDGELDYLSDFAFDTRTVTVRRATKFNPSYPSDFTSFVATMEQPEWDTGTITLKLRDVFYNVATAPLQTNKYLGNNALPAGLEGTAELAGKSKPVCLGVARMVPAPCVNTSKLIYQVNDGAVNSVDAAYDRGVALLQGRAWTPLGGVSAGGSPIYAVTHGGGLWVAASQAGDVYTSADAVTWTLRASAIGTARAAAYGNGVWSIITDTHSVTSSDGITWTTHPAPFITGANVFTSETYHQAAGLFIVVSGGGDIDSSPDGVTWTHVTTFTGNSIFGIAYGFDLAVFVGANGDAYSSANGATWTKRASAMLPIGATFFSAIAFGNDRFVAVGSGACAVSADGINWDRVDSPITTGSWIGYAGQFITNLLGSSNIVTSTDGFNWIPNTIPLTAGTVVAIGSDGVTAVLTSIGGAITYTTPATYASQADLLDDTKAPMAGSFMAYLAGGYVRLGSSPDAQPLFDVTQGATAASRAAAGLAAVVLARVPGAPTFNSGDLTTLAGLTSAPLGSWDFDSGATCDAVLDQIAGSVGAAWYPDKSGAFRIAQFTAPSGTPALTLTKSDIKAGTLQRIASNDQGNGIPLYQVVMQYARYYQTITTDIAGAVSDAARADFAQEWRNAPSTDLSVLTAHPSAGVLTIQSLFAVKADAQTEADRQLALRKVKRDPYELTVELNDETDALDLNSVIEIVHPRYSLSVVGSPSDALTGVGTQGGGLFRILDARPNAEAREVTLTVWGGARYKNVVDANGAYVTDSNGAFVVAGIAA